MHITEGALVHKMAMHKKSRVDSIDLSVYKELTDQSKADPWDLPVWVETIYQP